MSFSEQFIQIMDYIGQQIGIVIDWTSQNITPYLADLFARLVKFMAAQEVASLVFLIIIMIICFVFAKIFRKKSKASCEKYGCDEGWFFFGLGFLLCMVAGFCMLIPIYDCISNLIEVIFIPEKAIIEYLLEVKYLIQ